MSLSLWNRLQHSKSRSGRRRSTTVRPQLEGMEQRLALSVSVSLVNGQLLVSGDNLTNHTITLDHVGLANDINAETIVTADGQPHGFFDVDITGGIHIDDGDGGGTINIQATV